MPIKKCQFCKTEFKARENKTKFCGRDCSNRAKSNKVTSNCKNCNKEFAHRPSEQRRATCSVKCKNALGWTGRARPSIKAKNQDKGVSYYWLQGDKLIRSMKRIKGTKSWDGKTFPEMISCCCYY